MASLPRRERPPPMSATASGSNNAVMPVTSPAFSLATNNRSKSWGSLAGSLVVKSFIVTLRLSDCGALYLYDCAVCLLSYYVVPFLSYCVERGLSRPPGSAAPHPVADKLISLFLRQGDLASASESLCRGLGSRWFTERFHRNALVTLPARSGILYR